MPPGNGQVVFRRCNAVPKRVNVFDLLFFRQRFETFGEVGKWWRGHLSSGVSTKPSLSTCHRNTGRQIVHTGADLLPGASKRSDGVSRTSGEAYRARGLKKALGHASQSSQDGGKSALQIVADGRVLQEVVTHLMSTALFETKTDGDRRRITGMHSDEFYFEAVE